jgi:ABC-type transport system substrate-binding protein
LAEAGYPDGVDPSTGRRLKLTLSIGRPTQDSREAGELLASFYARIGIKLELRFQTWHAFLNSISKGNAQIFMLAWVADYPDAENFLQLFYSKNMSPGPNHSRYSNPEFDAEYEKGLQALTAEERNIHWHRCQEIIREDCPWIFTHITKNYTLVNRRVRNYQSHDFPYGQERHYRTSDK